MIVRAVAASRSAVLLAVFLGSGSTAMAAGLEEAVTYVERQDRPDAEANGRAIKAGSGRNGLDINSKVEIKFDKARIAAALAPLLPPAQDDPRTRTMLAQLGALNRAAERIPDLAKAARKVTDAFTSPDVSREEYEQALGGMAGLAREIFRTLLEAATARFTAGGLSDTEAEAAAREILNDFLRRSEGPGYRYDLLFDLLGEEIRWLNKEVGRLVLGLEQGEASDAVGVEVRAHLLRKDGSQVPIRLPGHNEVTAGPAQPYQKIQTDLSPQEKKVYEEAGILARKLGEAKDLSAAFRTSMKLSLEGVTTKVKAAASDLREAAEAARTSVESLAGWAAGPRLESWVRDVRRRGALPSEVQEAVHSFGGTLADVRRDLQALSALPDLEDALKGMSAGQAYDALVRAARSLAQGGTSLLRADAWKARLDAGRDLIAAVEEANLLDSLRGVEGPVKAWFEAKDRLEDLGAKVSVLRDVLAGIFQTSDIFTGIETLPEPTGQKRVPLNQELDTTFDLQTIEGGREDGDGVRVGYRFFVRDKRVEGWEDDFTIEVYGWQSNVLAALAFAEQRTAPGDRTWRPAPSVSWILTRRSWPRQGESGAKGVRFVGIGLSVLSLGFEEEQDVEIGIAPTVSFLDDFVQVGYGRNLQSPRDDQFAFFSIRAFEFSGAFNPAK